MEPCYSSSTVTQVSVSQALQLFVVTKESGMALNQAVNLQVSTAVNHAKTGALHTSWILQVLNCTERKHDHQHEFSLKKKRSIKNFLPIVNVRSRLLFCFSGMKGNWKLWHILASAAAGTVFLMVLIVVYRYIRRRNNNAVTSIDIRPWSTSDFTKWKKKMKEGFIYNNAAYVSSSSSSSFLFISNLR